MFGPFPLAFATSLNDEIRSMPSTPVDRILAFEDYLRRRHPTPYVVALEGKPAVAGDTVARDESVRLLLFGVRHSSDPSDPLFPRLAESFAAFAPRLALHEGTPPALEAERETAIRRHGESGLLRHLSEGAGIRCESMDIALDEEARRLLTRHPPRDLVVFFVVRQLASFNRKTARMDFDAYFRDFFDLISPGLGLGRLDWPLVQREHQRVFGFALVPRQVDASLTDPTRTEVLTQRIARDSNRMRDEWMLKGLLQATRAHRRVFATVGVTHAVMLEPALRAALE